MPSCLILDAEMQCSLPIIESLRKRGFQVTVGSHKRVNVGFFSRYPNRRILYPHPEKSPGEFLDKILDLAKRHRYDFILPVDDPSSELLAEHGDAFRPYTSILVVDHKTFMKARDKSQTIRLAQHSGVPCPHTLFPDDEDVKELAELALYPVLVKPNVASGARGIALVERKEDLEPVYHKVKAEHGECHIQEYIPKGGMQYKADLFVGRNQELCAGMVYSKLRYFPINGGSSIINRTVEKPEIIRYAHDVLRAMGWTGFADFDFITDPRDGTPKIMEINPRIPACYRITVAAGIDFTQLIADFAMGREVPTIRDYRLDVYLRYLTLDVMWFINSPERFTAKPSFFKFFGKDLHDQVISVRDPGPIVGFCLANVIGLFDRKYRKSRYSRGW